MFRFAQQRYGPRQCTSPGLQVAGYFCLEMIAPEDRLNVLVVEDDDNDLILLRRAMRKLGTVEKVMWVQDGEQACAYLNGDAHYANRIEYPLPDLLVLDQQLPGLTGLDILRWLRRQTRFDRLPVVVCSTFAPAQEIIVRRLNAACCAKSADSNEMQRAVGDAIVCAFRLASLVPDVAWYRSQSVACGSPESNGGRE
jgi:CheY-like chemotaxis protein